MEVNWTENIGRLDAVRHLCLEHAVTAEHPNLLAKLPMLIGDAFMGQPARLNENKDLTALADAIIKVKSQMEKLKLKAEHEMLPLLWLRLALQADVKLKRDIFQILGHWILRQGTQAAVLLQYKDTKTGDWSGPKFNIAGIGEVHGYTLEEVLLAKKPKYPLWPYSREWKMVPIERPTEGTKPLTDQILNSTPEKLEQELSSLIVTSTKKSSKRKRPSLEVVRERCGTKVIEALELILPRAAKSITGLLSAPGRDKRQYDCPRSLDQLVDELKNKYPQSLSCAKSTLKKALPAFVACPRGRPGGIAIKPIVSNKPIKKR